MKDKKIQEKEKRNLQLQNKKKLEKLKEKGITLIALVVTIIILLILAGVTLNMALSGDGLFSRARNAADKYKKAQEDEQELISEIGKEMNSEYVGAFVTGYEPDKKAEGSEYTVESSKSGVDEEQKFATEEMEWRIWDYDGTILRIISDKPTKTPLIIKGAKGYNNGVYLMNEICRQCYGQYDENGKMKQGISVANLRRSDIEKVNAFDYTDIRLDGENYNLDIGEKIFGTDINYSNDEAYYPRMWGENDKKWKYQNNDGMSKEDENYLIWETEGNIDNNTEDKVRFSNETFEWSGWGMDYYNKEKLLKNRVYYELLFPSEDPLRNPCFYWLATRCLFTTR